jgi:hypothetical protein
MKIIYIVIKGFSLYDILIDLAIYDILYADKIDLAILHNILCVELMNYLK